MIAAVRAGIIAELAAPDAWGQEFPSKVVRITSAYPRGISPDVATRLVADGLAKARSQQVIVEPRPGGDGFIAIGAVRRAAPGGDELLPVAPRGTPPAMVQRISADAGKVLGNAQLQKRFGRLGPEPAPTAPAQMAEVMRADWQRYRDLVRKIGIAPG